MVYVDKNLEKMELSYISHQNVNGWTSLVAQWLRIRLTGLPWWRSG